MSVREPGVNVTFENFPVLHGLESKAAGREVYVDKPHVRISVAGMDKDHFFGPVNEQVKARFPEEWDAFLRHAEAPTTGTPIEKWPFLFSKPSQVKNLLSLGFKTVEDLAAAADMSIQKVMGGHKLRADALAYLSHAVREADVAQMEELKASAAKDAATIETQGRQIAELQQQMAEILKARESEPKKNKREIAAPA